MRWLRVAYPEAAIVGTDVYSPGVEFCAGTFGSTPIVSGADFDNVPTCPTSDLIWVGSVFTHLTESGSRKLLNNVSDWLSPEGLVVFSVHGRETLWAPQGLASCAGTMRPDMAIRHIKGRPTMVCL
jgi:SAM-dependent methyltransferase